MPLHRIRARLRFVINFPCFMSLDQVAPASQAKKVSGLRQLVLYGNLQIPVVAIGLMTGSAALLGQSLSWPLLAASGAGAFLIYLIDRAWLVHQEDPINQPERVAWYTDHPLYAASAFGIASIVLGLAVFQLSRFVVFSGGLLGLAGIAYLKSYGNTRSRLKSHWLFKPLSIAGAWTLGAIILPAFAFGWSFDVQLLVLAIYRFTFILPNVILADWPDRVGDAAASLNSLAVIKGDVAVRRWATGLASLALTIGIGQLLYFSWPMPYWVDLGGPLLMIYAAQRSFDESHWFYGLVVDLIVAWPLITAGVTGAIA